jgi:uncharacterized protein YjiS (DUF1127 family)
LTRRLVCTLQSAWGAYKALRAERETIRLLHGLDNRTLKDIGLDRSEIESVAHHPAHERRMGIDARAATRSARLGMCT